MWSREEARGRESQEFKLVWGGGLGSGRQSVLGNSMLWKAAWRGYRSKSRPAESEMPKGLQVETSGRWMGAGASESTSRWWARGRTGS
jgi:hypothetical protein